MAVGGSLTTTVFRKKTHSDRYLDFDSHHPLAHKVAVARTLLTRADHICGSAPDRDVEKRRITEALNSNGYPTALVKKNWHPTPHSTPPLELNTPKAVVVIPYVKHLSESIRRILSPLKIRTCFRPHRTLRQALVNLKARVPFQQKAGVIYRIPCSGCPRVYVGQTGRTLAQRLKEHKRALVSGHLAQSAVAEHAAQESHDIDWEGATVMDIQQQYHQRCLLESWHIRSELNTMNIDEGNLPPVYDLLVRQLRSSD